MNQTQASLDIIKNNIALKTESAKDKMEKILSSSLDWEYKTRRLRRLRNNILGYTEPFDYSGLFIEELKELRDMQEVIFNKIQQLIKGEI